MLAFALPASNTRPAVAPPILSAHRQLLNCSSRCEEPRSSTELGMSGGAGSSQTADWGCGLARAMPAVERLHGCGRSKCSEGNRRGGRCIVICSPCRCIATAGGLQGRPICVLSTWTRGPAGMRATSRRHAGARTHNLYRTLIPLVASGRTSTFSTFHNKEIPIDSGGLEEVQCPGQRAKDGAPLIHSRWGCSWPSSTDVHTFP